MALIACPECKRDISDRAAFCPQCGSPMNAPRTATEPPVQIEQTGKDWKIVQAGGAALMLLGSVACMAALGNPGSDPIVGSGLAGIGLLAYITGRVGAWWFHG